MLRDDAAGLSALSDDAEIRVNDASSALEEMRAQRDEAARSSEVAAERVDGLSTEHAALIAVSVPAGTDELDERRRAAADAVRAASIALEKTEQADSEARAARKAAVAQGPLEQALRDLHDLEGLITSLAPAQARLQQARDRRAAADTALESAEPPASSVSRTWTRPAARTPPRTCART